MQTQTHAFFILFILILIQSIKSQETQCKDIKPKSAADCKLANSGNDKTWNKYCCFKKPQFGKPASCEANMFLIGSEPCYNATNLPPNDCEYIVPEKTSDCVLSENDKKKYEFTTKLLGKNNIYNIPIIKDIIHSNKIPINIFLLVIFLPLFL